MDLSKIKEDLIGETGEEVLEPFIYWISFPAPRKDPADNIWSDFELFDGGSIEIQNRVDWYESPNVPAIYESHVDIIDDMMGVGRPAETYFEQNVDTGDFAATIEASESLPSNSGDLELEIEIETKAPPQGDNNFTFVEYFVKTYLSYSMPGGVTFLPRIFARPLNRFFRWAFLRYIGEEVIEHDGEYARERTNEYFNYIRKYHGEEPVQTKTRQASFKPMIEDGVFFQ